MAASMRSAASGGRVGFDPDSIRSQASQLQRGISAADRAHDDYPQEVREMSAACSALAKAGRVHGAPTRLPARRRASRRM
jgi:hypothetical protein